MPRQIRRLDAIGKTPLRLQVEKRVFAGMMNFKRRIVIRRLDAPHDPATPLILTNPLRRTPQSSYTKKRAPLRDMMIFDYASTASAVRFFS